MDQRHSKRERFRRLRAFVVVLLMTTALCRSLALGPHETLLLVNEAVVESIVLANVYQRLRNIPERNVIRLTIPRSVYDGVSTDLSPEAFTDHIWEPMQAAMREAGIRQQILACVFSCGFPTRITTEPAISITGAVFLRNQFPKAEWIDGGRYVSALFSGPVGAETPMGTPETFDSARNRLLEAMPFPAMMLAFTGANGMSLGDAVAHLERTAAADHTHPRGTFYFAVNDDVRSTCRHWEFEPVAQAIRERDGFSAVISPHLPPADGAPLCGFMTGSRTVPLDRMALVPGAYADNLTSFGAAFDRREHTKATAWLKAGAGFSSGTVTEPYALWTKFPHACIFLHSLAGCTAIESLYLSVRSPLQILPLGDPLSKPWAPLIEPVITAPPNPLSGTVTLRGSVTNERTDVFYRFQWLVNGRVVGSGRSFVWNTRALDEGRHDVRLVVRHQIESVRHQGFVEHVARVSNSGGEAP